MYKLWCLQAIRAHPDYEGDQNPGRRWFDQSRESRVTGWNRAKKTKVLEYKLYLERCRYECASGSESQNQGRWRITLDVWYNHDQGTLVVLSVIFMAAGVCKVQSPSPSSWTREARVASRRGNVTHFLRVN